MGFFTREELAATNVLASEPLCIRCGLGGPEGQMKVSGQGREGILLVMDYPEVKETEAGAHWQGGASKHLQRVLRQLSIDVERDCWRVDAIRCRTEGREPSPKEIDACRPSVFKAVRELKPRKVILFGDIALDSYLAHRWDKKLGGIYKWRGLSFPDRANRCWVYPVMSPRWVLRESKQLVVGTVFERDLQKAIESVTPLIDWTEKAEDGFRVLTHPKDIIISLREFAREKELVAFDYEATGLKPFDRSVHDVHTASMASERLGGVAFPMLPEVRQAWCHFLCSECPKTAHNLKFEETWSRIIFNTPVRNWKWCSMQAAHIIDNRRGFSGLKFQAFINFGWLNWGDTMEAYLTSKGDSANAVNKVREAPIRKLLTYGGKDSVIQLQLAQRQMPFFGISI